MEGKLQNGKVTIDGERYLVYQQSISAYPEWKFTGLISYKGINRNLWQIYLVMFCIAVVMFLIVVMVSFRISKGITRPIQDVLGAMRKHLLVKKSDAENQFLLYGKFDVLEVDGAKKTDNNGKEKEITIHK